MGYNTHYVGRIDITPPLNVKEKRFLIERCQSEGTGGSIPNADGSALVWDGVSLRKTIEDELHEVIGFLRPDSEELENAAFDGFTFDHRCEGSLACFGEEFLDIWSLRVSNHRLDRENKQLNMSADLDVIDAFGEKLEEAELDDLQAIFVEESEARQKKLEAIVGTAPSDLASLFLEVVADIADCLPNGNTLAEWVASKQS